MKEPSSFNRGLMASLFVVSTLLGCSGPSNSGDVQRVQFLIDWKAEPTYAGFFLAQELGYFEAEGLDVSIVEGNGASTAVQVVGDGGANPIGTASGAATVIGVARGIPIKSVAVVYPEVATVIYSLARAPIRSPRDLSGRRIGLIAGSVTKDEFWAMIRANDVSPSSFDTVGVGFDATTLLSGQLDGLLNYAELTPVELSVRGDSVVTMPLRDYGVSSYGLNIIVNDRYLEEHPDVVRGVVTGATRGYAFLRSNPDSAAALFIRRFPERDPAFVRASIRVVAENLGRGDIGHQDQEGWSRTVATLVQMGLIKDPVPADSVMSELGAH